MNPRRPKHTRSPLVQPLALRAFTLAELMTMTAVFSLLVMGSVALQLFGMRMYRISETKLSATAGARNVLSHVREEIRSGKLLYVGNGDSSSFQLISDYTPHIGNALRIFPTVNTNSYIYYFLDTNQSCLKRMVSSNNQVQVIARFVTNKLVFQAEDFQGNVVSNYMNNRVIRMTLEFYQWEFPIAQVGAGSMYDYFRLQTRMARRLIE